MVPSGIRHFHLQVHYARSYCLSMTSSKMPFERGTVLVSRFLWTVAAEYTEKARIARRDRSDAAACPDALSAVVFAAMFVEAFLNEVSWYALEASFIEQSDSLARHDIERAFDMLNTLERCRAQPVEKVRMLSRMLPGSPLEHGAEPMQSLSTLFDIRNDIVHPKVKHSPRYVFAFMHKGMTVDKTKDQVQLAGWINQIQTAEIAAWACQTSRSVAKHIRSQIELLGDDVLVEGIVRFGTVDWTRMDPDPRVDWWKG